MLPQLYDLYYDFKDQFQLNLIAGENGLISTVSWIYVTEDIENASYLRGLELVITTGLTSNDQTGWLEQLIHQLITSSCSGLILNTGRYISLNAITQEIIDICNICHFPLFIMPWKIHISDVMQAFCNRIFLHIQQGNAITQLFEDLLCTLERPPEIYSELENHGFPLNGSYTVLLTDRDVPSVWMRRQLNNQHLKYHFFPYADGTLLILQNTTYPVIRDFLVSLCDKFSKINSENAGEAKNILLSAGVGEQVSSLKDLMSSFRQALHARNISDHLGKPFVFFKDLGVYRLLLSVLDTTLLQTIYHESLEPLLDYDKKNNTQLTDTLSTYFSTNENIQDTADQMYTHRNTINYRMKKIRSLLTMDLETPEDRLMLMLACHIRNLQK